jgi:membrane protein required for colicin V production
MTWVDGIILAVLAVSAIIAFLRGLVREVLGVGAWIGAVLAGFLALPLLRPLLAGTVDPPWLADALVIGGVFLAVLIVLKLIIGWIANRVQASMLGGIDRAFGTAFGLARGAFLVAATYIVAGLFLPAVERWPQPVREARSLPIVADTAEWLVQLLPPQYRPRVPEPPAGVTPTLDQLIRPPARERSAT